MFQLLFNKSKITILCLLILSFATTLCACSLPAQKDDKTPISKTGFLLNTIIQIDIYDSQDTALLDGCFSLCAEYEEIFSRTIESSEIYKINHSESKTIQLSDSTADIIRIGLEYGKLSNGLFDISIAPLTETWNFSSETPAVPSNDSIIEALTHIDYQKLSVTNDSVLTMEEAGMAIDLGGIAKGYIADRIKEYLLENGVKSAIINLGGNVLCVGTKPDGSDFHIGIQKPFGSQDETITAFSISDLSIVTSGSYERCFTEDGILYHHILDVTTGYPSNTGLLSVTILSPKSVDGDALSTSCFCLGLEEGMKLIESLDSTYAMFVTEDNICHYTNGTEEYLYQD